MDPHIFIAIVGAVINMILSVTVPCILKKTNQPMLNEAKQVFELNRQVILTSSLVIALTIYLTLKVAEEIDPSIYSLSGITDTQSAVPEVFGSPRIISGELNPVALQFLSQLQGLQN